MRSGFCTRCLFEHRRTEDDEGGIVNPDQEHINPLAEAIAAAVQPDVVATDPTTVRTGDSITPPPPRKPDPLADAVTAAVGEPR